MLGILMLVISESRLMSRFRALIVRDDSVGGLLVFMLDDLVNVVSFFRFGNLGVGLVVGLEKFVDVTVMVLLVGLGSR